MAALRTPLLSGVLARLGRLSVGGQGSARLQLPTTLTPLTSAINHSRLTPAVCHPALHTTASHRGLMEFFDNEKNWGEFNVKVGRAWRKEELRIKSNEDLHKLWYVLLKEKNMLLTMEHACEEEWQLLPNPERIDKVEESMKHLEEVVRERNRAYWLLETGTEGGRPGGEVTDALGRCEYKKFTEHLVPESMNPQTIKEEDTKEIKQFQRLQREKEYLTKKRALSRTRNHVCMLLRRFPNMDMDMLQQKYPEVDVRKLRKRKKSLGHHPYNIA